MVSAAQGGRALGLRLGTVPVTDSKTGRKQRLVRVEDIDPRGAAAQSSLRAGDVLLEIEDKDARSLEALVKDLLRQSGPTLRLLVQTPGAGKGPRAVTLELPGEAGAEHPACVPAGTLAGGDDGVSKSPSSVGTARNQQLDAAGQVQTEVAALQAELERTRDESRAAQELLAVREQELRDAHTAQAAREEEMVAAVHRCEASCAEAQTCVEAALAHAPLRPASLQQAGPRASENAVPDGGGTASAGALAVELALLQGQLVLQQAELQAARNAGELRAAQTANTVEERWAALDALQGDLAETQRQLAECRTTNERQVQELQEAVFAIESLHLAVFKNGQVPQLCGPGIAVTSEAVKHKGKVTATHIRVDAVAPGSSAAQSCVRAGDVLQKIDDEDVSRLDVGGVRNLLKGPAGSEVRIEGVSRDDLSLRQRCYHVTLRREPLGVSWQPSRNWLHALHDEGPRDTPATAAESGGLSIAEQGRQLCEAAAALHEVATWHAHRVQQLETLLQAAQAEAKCAAASAAAGQGLELVSVAPSTPCAAPREVGSSADAGETRRGLSGALQLVHAAPPDSALGGAARLAKHIGADGRTVRAPSPSRIKFASEAMAHVERAVASLYNSHSTLAAGLGGNVGAGAGGRVGGIGVALGTEMLRLHGKLVKMWKV